jgi:hypothetical protein
MLLYIKAPNYTRQDCAFKSPNEGTETCHHAPGAKPCCSEKMQMLRKTLHFVLAAGEAQSLLPHFCPDSHFVFPKWLPGSQDDVCISSGIWVVSLLDYDSMISPDWRWELNGTGRPCFAQTLESKYKIQNTTVQSLLDSIYFDGPMTVTSWLS